MRYVKDTHTMNPKKDNLAEVIQLYDPARLPIRIKKRIDLNKWRRMILQKKQNGR